MDAQLQKATVSKLTDTIEYVTQLVGPGHAGIGLDYSIDAEGIARYLRANPGLYGGGGQYPVDCRIDFAPPSMLPEVTNELVRRGFTDAEVRGILGENYLRVLDENTGTAP
jgi:membrane dipeptidase